MGQKDIQEKLLEDYNDVFCDILNVLLFKRKYLNEFTLYDGATESIYKADSEEAREQRRDVLKECREAGILLCSYGIENQSAVDACMAFRVMNYDSAYYLSQIKNQEKEIKPVITVVLNFSNRRWKKHSVLESLKVPEELKPYISDYKIHVFDIAFLEDETIRQFTSDFGIVADFFKQKRLNEKFQPSRQEIKHVEEVLELLSVMTDDQRYRNNIQKLKTEKAKGERISMCNVIDQYIEIGKTEGITEGIEIGKTEGIEIGKTEGIEIGKTEGIEIGKTEAFKNIIKKLKERGKSDEEIAALLDSPLEKIKSVQ